MEFKVKNLSKKRVFEIILAWCGKKGVIPGTQEKYDYIGAYHSVSYPNTLYLLSYGFLGGRETKQEKDIEIRLDEDHGDVKVKLVITSDYEIYEKLNDLDIRSAGLDLTRSLLRDLKVDDSDLIKPLFTGEMIEYKRWNHWIEYAVFILGIVFAYTFFFLGSWGRVQFWFILIAVLGTLITLIREWNWRNQNNKPKEDIQNP